MKSKWNLETMNDFCKENAKGYKVLDVKVLEKSYQKQLWALIKCPNKNHEPYWIFWNAFYSKGARCINCDYESKGKILWTKELAKQEYEKYGYIINEDDFKNVDTSIICYDKDGFMYKKNISMLRASEKCKEKQLFTRSNVKDSSKINLYNIRHYLELYADDYIYLEDKYYGVKEKVKFKYIEDKIPNDVDKEFVTTIDSFVNGGVRHPYFTRKQGEEIFKNILIENNTEFEQQKTFCGCKSKNLLQFDFYLPKYNCCIEIDGIQHYKPIEYFGGEYTYKYQVEKDNIKNEYCKQNNIKLIRIKYETNKKEKFIEKCYGHLRKITDKDIKL